MEINCEVMQRTLSDIFEICSCYVGNNIGYSKFQVLNKEVKIKAKL